MDTNILAVGSPGVPVPFAALVDWMDRASNHLFLSAVTATEVIDGIARCERQGASRKADRLRAWWSAVEHLYGAQRILPFDLDVAKRAGILADRARGGGTEAGFADVAIAATAERHGLIVLTRNVRHFQPLGVDHLNPYEGLPRLPADD